VLYYFVFGNLSHLFNLLYASVKGKGHGIVLIRC